MFEYEKWADYIGSLELNAEKMTEDEWENIIREDADRESQNIDDHIVSCILEELRKDGYVKGEEKFMKEFIGKTYEDPEGIWEIVKTDGKNFVIKNIQDGNINYGKMFAVPVSEVEYYLNA